MIYRMLAVPRKSIHAHALRRALLASLAAASCLISAHAAELSALWGEYKGYHNTTLAYQSSPLWDHDLANSRFDLSLEASAGQVSAPSGSSHGSLWHVGLTPFARWWFSAQSGIEVGIGANLFSGTRIGHKTISTAYQFGDSIGIFHRVAQTPWTLGLRLTHYSNADIKKPNPGQDYIQLRASYDFN